MTHSMGLLDSAWDGVEGLSPLVLCTFVHHETFGVKGSDRGILYGMEKRNTRDLECPPTLQYETDGESSMLYHRVFFPLEQFARLWI